jgi:hypothetical protein
LFLSSNFVLQHVINSLLHSKVSKDMWKLSTVLHGRIS